MWGSDLCKRLIIRILHVRGDAVEDEYTFVFVRKLCEKTSKMGCLRALKREKTDKKRQKKGTIQYII